MAVTLLEPLTRPLATTWSVDEIVSRVRSGRLSLPAVPRYFRWSADEVLKLFDSIYRGYPIGFLLLWETERTRGMTTRFGPVRVRPADGPTLVVIDGQQRVTSIVASLLRGERTDKRFDIAFDLERSVFASMEGARTTAGAILPLVDVADTVRFLRALEARDLSAAHVRLANELMRAFREYRVPVYIVQADDDREAMEIFTRLSSTTNSLTSSEIFAALRNSGAPRRSVGHTRRETRAPRLDARAPRPHAAQGAQREVNRQLGRTTGGTKRSKT